MALAVGILVDDATVEIENVHRNMGMAQAADSRHSGRRAADRAAGLVSTLAICIVFIPVLLLTGPAKFLFTPLALAVVFAMLMSYFLTRTLVPTMVHYMLRSGGRDLRRTAKKASNTPGLIWKTHHAFNRSSRKCATIPQVSAGACIIAFGHRFMSVRGRFARPGRVIGTDFFPYVDSGQIRLHVRAPGRHTHRRDRAHFRRRGADHPRRISSRAIDRHYRQHWLADRLRPRVGRQRHDQLRGRRDSDFAQSRTSPSDGASAAGAAQGLARAFPG